MLTLDLACRIDADLSLTSHRRHDTDGRYIMHDVTLGATGTSPEHDRHPKVGNDVLLGANSSILGNVVIGDGARVAAAAVVNKDVPPGATAVGVPAKMLTINKTGSS